MEISKCFNCIHLMRLFAVPIIAVVRLLHRQQGSGQAATGNALENQRDLLDRHNLQ